MNPLSITVSRPSARPLAALAAGLAVATTATIMVVGRALPASLPSVGGPVAIVAYEPHQLLVTLSQTATGGKTATGSSAVTYVRAQTGVDVTLSSQNSGDPDQALLQVPDGVSVTALQHSVDAALAAARPPGIRTIASADDNRTTIPITGTTLNYMAQVSGTVPRLGKRFVPNDPGSRKTAGGWQFKQWNFKPRAGVSAPGAWGNLIADGRPGAKGVTIAVIDTGVAFENWGRYRESPDFDKTTFVDPCDLVHGHITAADVCTDPNAIDMDGHGTFVAGEIAESTNNGLGLTGLAYGANIIPIRALGVRGFGSESAVATGIRYAVAHGAQVINLSLDFPGVQRKNLRGVIDAIAYARRRKVTVVAASGNQGHRGLNYPAADPQVISVGATTYDQCLAQYSNYGRGLDLVAPGGSDDAALKQRNCHPNLNQPSLYQMDFGDAPGRQKFSLIPMFGTSMAAAEVSSAAAMVIASGVLGAHPSPAAIENRLEATARRLDGTKRNDHYGYGLLDIWKATSPGGPKKP